MRIKFTGYLDIAPEDEPDDQGSVDVWILNLMADAVKEDTDKAYDMLQLSWNIEDANPNR